MLITLIPAKAVKKHTQDVKQLVDGVSTQEEKIKTYFSKYSQLYYDFKKQERELQVQKRKVEQVTKEKETGTASNAFYRESNFSS